jgi:hypothetical protein
MVSGYTAELIAELLFNNVFRRGFISEKIVTDRDPKITKSFWQTLTRRLNLKHCLTIAWHVHTGGAAERLNQTLETAIRAYVSPQLDNWPGAGLQHGEERFYRSRPAEPSLHAAAKPH